MSSRRAWLLVVCLTVLLGVPAVARADRVSDLSRTLRNSRHHKARIAAAVSLGRIRDRRALKPLVHALRDSNRTVRVIAATALGHLGETAALGALRRASRDKDRLVRKRAMEAIARIRNRRALKNRSNRRMRLNARDYRPEMYVIVKSTRDESAGRLSKRVRRRRANKMRSLVLRQLQRTPIITTSSHKARRFHLDPHSIDVSITSFKRKVRGRYVEIECKLRVAISNKRGKMESVLTGGAKVQVPVRTFRRRYLPQLRLEALENAVKGVHRDLMRNLRHQCS